MNSVKIVRSEEEDFTRYLNKLQPEPGEARGTAKTSLLTLSMHVCVLMCIQLCEGVFETVWLMFFVFFYYYYFLGNFIPFIRLQQ